MKNKKKHNHSSSQQKYLNRRDYLNENKIIKDYALQRGVSLTSLATTMNIPYEKLEYMLNRELKAAQLRNMINAIDAISR